MDGDNDDEDDDGDNDVEPRSQLRPAYAASALTPKVSQLRPAYAASALTPKVSRALRHKLANAVHDFGMIQDGDRVLIGLSGGKDSLSLLHILL